MLAETLLRVLESSRDLQEPGCILYREEGLDMSFTLGTIHVWFGQVSIRRQSWRVGCACSKAERAMERKAPRGT